jgi:hypothetical protein
MTREGVTRRAAPRRDRAERRYAPASPPTFSLQNASDENRDALVKTLNRALASSIDLFMQGKHAHWNVESRAFVELHELFDRIADHARKQADAYRSARARLFARLTRPSRWTEGRRRGSNEPWLMRRRWDRRWHRGWPSPAP